MQTPSRYRVITNIILKVLVNVCFYRVSAENNQRWSTCRVYIEIKDEHILLYNLEGSRRL